MYVVMMWSELSRGARVSKNDGSDFQSVYQTVLLVSVILRWVAIATRISPPSTNTSLFEFRLKLNGLRIVSIVAVLTF